MHIPFPMIHTLLTSHWLPVTETPKSLVDISPNSSIDAHKATAHVIPRALAVSVISKLGALSSVLVSPITTFRVLC